MSEGRGGSRYLFSHQVVSDSSVIPQTVAHRAPLSMGFPRQEYWGGLPFPSPGDLLDPGTEPASPREALGASTGLFKMAELQ